jgi:hypothetical protein
MMKLLPLLSREEAVYNWTQFRGSCIASNSTNAFLQCVGQVLKGKTVC